MVRELICLQKPPSQGHNIVTTKKVPQYDRVPEIYQRSPKFNSESGLRSPENCCQCGGVRVVDVSFWYLG